MQLIFAGSCATAEPLPHPVLGVVPINHCPLIPSFWNECADAFFVCVICFSGFSGRFAPFFLPFACIFFKMHLLSFPSDSRFNPLALTTTWRDIGWFQKALDHFPRQILHQSPASLVIAIFASPFHPNPFVPSIIRVFSSSCPTVSLAYCKVSQGIWS